MQSDVRLRTIRTPNEDAMPMKLTDEAKVGIVVGLAIALFVAGMISFGGFHLRKSGYVLNIRFQDATGLEKGDPIAFSGVRVGNVRKMWLEEGKVIVSVWVDSRYRFPRDSVISIGLLTLMGDKYVDVKPGMSTEVFEADEVAEGTAAAADVMALSKSVKPILERLTRVLERTGTFLDEEAETEIKTSLANIQEITGGLKKAIPNHSHDLKALVDKLQAVATDVEEITEPRKEQIGQVIDRMEASSHDLAEAAGHLRVSSDALREVMRRMRAGEGTLGMLMTDERLYTHLDSLVVDLDDLVRDFRMNPKKYIRVEIF